MMEELFESLTKSLSMLDKQQKMQFIFFVVDCCYRYNKKPEVVINTIKKVAKLVGEKL